MNTDEKKIWNIISRKLADSLNEEDEYFLEKWINAREHNRTIYKTIKEYWGSRSGENVDVSGIYNSYRNRVSGYAKKNKRYSWLTLGTRVAALLFLFASITTLVYYWSEKPDNLVYNEISVPKGNRTMILLPDSSKVWISNNTTLKYPVKFASGSRETFLSGEAFFEVKQNRKNPFIVNIGRNRIKVLGTSFHVNAHSDEELVTTDLISGIIQFDIPYSGVSGRYQTITLSPGTRLVYNKIKASLIETTTPDGFYDYWQKGSYLFRDESIESLARKIERIYNVSIVFEDETLKSKRYSGILNVNDNIFAFMENIKQISVEPIEYRMEKNKIYVKRKEIK